jgi:hypothetical protein
MLAVLGAEPAFAPCFTAAVSAMAAAASGAASGDPDGLASPLSSISPASTLLKLDAAAAWFPPPPRAAGLPADEMDGEDGGDGGVEAPCSAEGLSMALFLCLLSCY